MLTSDKRTTGATTGARWSNKPPDHRVGRQSQRHRPPHPGGSPSPRAASTTSTRHPGTMSWSAILRGECRNKGTASRPARSIFTSPCTTTEPDIGAVVHTHSVYATTLACLHREIPAVHYLVGFAGSQSPAGALRHLRHRLNWPDLINGQPSASSNAVLHGQPRPGGGRPGYRSRLRRRRRDRAGGPRSTTKH
jgi:hypothetical protein